VLVHRPRRLRRTPAIRNLIRETNLHRHDFVLPLFVSEKIESAKEIASMPGICQYAGKEIATVAQRAYESGVQAVLLFGIPKSKDEQAREAYAENGVVQNAVRQVKKHAPDLTVITDVCLCEYTNHGHCGVTHCDGEHFHVLNDESVELIAKSAVSHAVAGRIWLPQAI
jgi:porphobilinogen synthase